MLSKCIEVIEAQETMLQLKVADFPMMKDEARKKLYQGLKRQAFPSTINGEAKPITTEELAKFLSAKV